MEILQTSAIDRLENLCLTGGNNMSGKNQSSTLTRRGSGLTLNNRRSIGTSLWRCTSGWWGNEFLPVLGLGKGCTVTGITKFATTLESW